MQIKDMFKKPIDRPINGVIKVGQDSEEVIKQELEEYVVTEELEDHFHTFFKNYSQTIGQNTDQVGVWISGFFGSGKSHFLKILSYLVEDREVAGKRARDYIIEGEKIENKETLAYMEKLGSIENEVILFNIDAQSQTPGTKGADTILNVFLKVFDEHLGHSTNPHLADFERYLDKEGHYQAFQDTYRELTGDSWVETRNEFDFIVDDVVQALVNAKIMSEEAAWNWVESTNQEYKISVIDFARLVKEYLDRQGPDSRLAFFVDEVGQFIGDSTDLMLNLQTLTEELGNHCQGRAWIIVTSQQDIDSISKVKGDDFSKIQGRFNTRISLTSSNVDEVIKIRILEKTPTAQDSLEILYDSHESQIRNILLFTDGPEIKLYKDGSNFADIYPFVPYQFDILGKVLTAIRKSGASGKHLSEGERSLLAMFKEAAEKMMDEEAGVLAPFYTFYDSLESWLDHSHSSVIKRAKNNANINPDGEENNFTVNVLKSLFMVKYVDEMEANLENITSMMVDHINTDRLLLQDRVEEALGILTKEMLIQKNGDNYIFLTNEEQEVNRMIAGRSVDQQEIINEISKDIFTDIYMEDRVSMSKDGRYTFNFNREVDGIPYNKDRSYDFGLKIYTPLSSISGQEANLVMQSGGDNNLYVDLAGGKDFIEEYREALKIEKFLRHDLTSAMVDSEDIARLKSKEMADHRERARAYLREALDQADIYLNGYKLEAGPGSITTRLDENLQDLVRRVYYKISYIDHPYTDEDLVKLLAGEENLASELDREANAKAVDEVRGYIQRQSSSQASLTMRDLINEFTARPYGFANQDIHWIIGRLFKDGEIGLVFNGSEVNFMNASAEEIASYISSSRTYDKVLIREKAPIAENKKDTARYLAREVFRRTISSNDPAEIAQALKDSALNLNRRLDLIYAKYPASQGMSYEYKGKEVIEGGLRLTSNLSKEETEAGLIDYVNDHEEDLLDLAEAYPPVEDFFSSETKQREYWDKAVGVLDIYDDSARYIDGEDIVRLAEEIRAILRMAEPYDEIYRLPDLTDQLLLSYGRVLDKEAQPIREAIRLAREEVLASLAQRQGQEDLDPGQVQSFKARVEKTFKDLEDDLDRSQSIARTKSYANEADNEKIKLLDDIHKIDPLVDGVEEEGPEQVQPKGPEVKNLSFKRVNPRTSLDLRTEEDVEGYVRDLEGRLKGLLEEDKIIRIRF